MSSSPAAPVLPSGIVPLQGSKVEKPRQAEPPDLRDWQIEEFLRQTGEGGEYTAHLPREVSTVRRLVR